MERNCHVGDCRARVLPSDVHLCQNSAVHLGDERVRIGLVLQVVQECYHSFKLLKHKYRINSENNFVM
eukprot:3399276-Amphidinium_carterae.1